MEAPDIPRTRRMVRDYSTDGMMAPPSRLRTRSISSQERWQSPQEWSVKSRSIEQINGGDFEDPRKLDYNLLAPVGEKTYEPSISTQHTATTGTSTSKIADFFGHEVFQIVLRNPTTAHQLKKFAQSRLCGENLEFLEMVCWTVPVPNEAPLTHCSWISTNTRSIRSRRRCSISIGTSSRSTLHPR